MFVIANPSFIQSFTPYNPCIKFSCKCRIICDRLYYRSFAKYSSWSFRRVKPKKDKIIQGLKRRATYDEEDGTLIDMAIRECTRIRDLIRSLQDFNRPSTGRPVRMNIHTTLDSLLLLSKKEFHTKGITVQTHYAAEMPKIKAVADQIKQVLLKT